MPAIPVLLGGGAATSQTIAVTNANLFFSPYNWFSDGGGAMASTNIKASSTYAQTNAPGAYLKFKVTVSGGAGSVKLNVDGSILSGLTSSTCPTLSHNYDGRPFTDTLLATATTQVTLATGLSNGTYAFEVHFKSVGGTALGNANRWDTGSAIYAVKVTGIEIDASASIPSQTLRSERILAYGDSFAEGINMVLANDDEANDTLNVSNDAVQSFVGLVARGFDAEYGLVAYGGIGVVEGMGNQSVSSTRPAMYSATAANRVWDFYHLSAARDIASPVAPDYLLIDCSANDSSLSAASVTAWIDALRTAVGSDTWIFWVWYPVPATANKSTVQTGVANAASTARTKFIDMTSIFEALTPSIYSGDAAFGGSHPNVRGHAHSAAVYIKEMQDDILAAAASSGSQRVIGG